MTEEHISHRDITQFADDHVNLKREDASKYRTQVNGLRERLESHLRENPDFALKKMLLSGSLAKGTALKSLNDIDVGLYVEKEDGTQSDMPEFIDWLVDTLRNLYPNMDPSQVTPQQHSVRISFRGSGLDVDIVPILYDGSPVWDGYLYSTDRDEWLKTNISRHIEFIKERKRRHPQHFVQIARLLKYWVKEVKKGDGEFRFKSFLVELVLAHAVDSEKIDMDNYAEALANYFHFIVVGGLDKIIMFEDYYKNSTMQDDGKPIRIFDPVNPENNAAKDYQLEDKRAIVAAAEEAADAVDAALYAITKGETVRYWQKVFGSSFGG